MAKEHTLLQDGEGNIIKPFTDAEIVATKSGRSKLSTDLEAIDDHIKGVLNGSVIVNHSLKTNRFDGERSIMFEGDIEGTAKWDGSSNLVIPAKVSGNTHEHPIDKIEGLQDLLDQKSDINHTHEDYANFKTIQAVTKTGTTDLVSDSSHRTLKIEAGDNIILEPDATGRGLKIKAIMEGAAAESAESANSIKGIKLDSDTIRSANERYIPTATYGQHLIAGRGFYFHLAGSTKEFDAKLSLTLANRLVWQLPDEAEENVFHSGFMGHNSGMDADMLDGRHGHEFALDGHEHDEYISKDNGGTLERDLVLANNVAIQGLESDNFTSRSLLMVSGLDQALVGNPNLPLRLRHNGDIGCIDQNGNVTNIFHGGNLPTWDEISGKPESFLPESHRHAIEDIDYVSSNNEANTLVKRDENGSFGVNQVISNEIQAGSGTDANTTKAILDAYHLRFYAKGFNYIQGEGANSSLVFLTNGNTSLKVLHLTKEGNGVFGQNLEVTNDLSVGGSSSIYGGLSVSGATTLRSSLGVTGNTTLGGTLGVTGDTTLNGLSVSSGLTVSGGTTLNSSLTVNGDAEIKSDLTFQNNNGVKMKDTSGTSIWTLWVGTDNKTRLGDSALDLEIRSSANPKVKVGDTVYTMYHTGYKPSAADVGALSTSHASAAFGYNSTTGRITHNGNDVKVLNSTNADLGLKVRLSSSGGTGNYTMWVGPESDNKTSGFIHFCTA